MVFLKTEYFLRHPLILFAGIKKAYLTVSLWMFYSKCIQHQPTFKGRYDGDGAYSISCCKYNIGIFRKKTLKKTKRT